MKILQLADLKWDICTTCQIYFLNTDWWQRFCTCEQSLRWVRRGTRPSDQIKNQERPNQAIKRGTKGAREAERQEWSIVSNCESWTLRTIVQRGFILDEYQGTVGWCQRRWWGRGGGIILDVLQRENFQRRVSTMRRLESRTDTTLLVPETPEMVKMCHNNCLCYSSLL